MAKSRSSTLSDDAMVGVCVSCAEVREGSACPKCGATLDRSLRAFEDWARERQRARVTEWIDKGTIKRNVGMRLLRSLDAPAPRDTHETHKKPGNHESPAAVNTASPRPIDRKASRAERGGDKLASGLSSFTSEVGARWSALVVAIDSNEPPSSRKRDHDDDEHDDIALDAGRSVFAREGHSVTGAGVDALAALDDDAPFEGAGEAKPLGALQVFWFIGVVLVLAGSVMGVREAWRTLEGVTRQLVIGGALFVYHALFVVLSRVLVKRSHTTGRVLAGIASGLLPIAFVAIASAVGTSRRVGVPFAIMLTLASIATLMLAGRAFAGSRGKTGIFLAAALVPSLVLELPLAAAPTSLSIRLFAPLAALAPLILSSARLRIDLQRALPTRNAVVALAAASYGAIAVALFAAFGGPLDDALDLSGGTHAQILTTVWIGLFGAIAWWSAAALETSSRYPRTGILLSLVSLALVIGAMTAAAVSALGRVPDRDAGLLRFAPFALGALATAIVVAEQRRRLGVIHLVAPIGVVTVLLLARVILPLESRGIGIRGVAALSASTVIVPAALLAFSAWSHDVKRRLWSSIWGVVSGAIILTITLVIESSNAPSMGFATGSTYAPFTATAFTAAVLVVAAHAGARMTRAWLHVYASLAALVGVAAILLPMRRESGAESFVYACAALGAIYGVLALPYASMVKNANDTRRPFDDVSLFFGVLGLVVAVIGSSPTGALAASMIDAERYFPRAIPVIFIGALLLARAPRDASALVTFFAAGAFAYAIRLVTNVASFGQVALFTGLSCLGASVVAVLRGKTPSNAPRWGRAIGGVVPLPFGARGFVLLDGFAFVALTLSAIASASSVLWIATASTRMERSGVIYGMIAIVLVGMVAFGTRAFTRLGARGSVVTLALGGVAVAICAIGNRIGRPLPPEIVGSHLTVYMIGVWIFSRAVVRYGPRIGEKLEKPTHGPHYHLVPHAGVLAIALLLLIDAWLVGKPTASRALAVIPPMMLLGGAIGALLLYRSFGFSVALHVALGALFLFAAVCAAERAIGGPALIPLDPPGGRWVPVALARALSGTPTQWLDPTRFLAKPDTEDALWARALMGSSIFVLASSSLVLAQSRVRAVGDVLGRVLLGREEDEQETIHTALSVWACIGALLLGVNLALAPSLMPALFLTVAGVVLVLARGHDKLGSAYRAIVVIVGAPLVVHALANRAAIVPAWAGPALGLLPLAITIACTITARRRERGTSTITDTELVVATLVAAAYAGGAVAYALAAGAPTNPRSAAPQIVGDAFDALGGGTWSRSSSLAVTLFVLSLAATALASTWRGGLAKILGVLPPLSLALAGAASVAALVFRSRDDSGVDLVAMLFYGDGALTGASIAAAATLAHAASIVSTRMRRDDLAWGLGAGRDVVVVALLAVIGAFVLARSPDSIRIAGVRVGPMGVLALGLGILVCVDAAFRQRTSRHVMLVEILLVALYAFATRELGLRPEIHAILGLGYGFTLLGVAIIARRRRIPAVSIATRRFAAALPILIALLTANGISDGLAMLALGSSLLYGAMAMAEKSRLFGSLAAIAANVALVVFALAQGLDGIEIFIGPLGLLVTALAQLFAPKMNAQTRSIARILGGLLLYLPAGLKLTLRLGAAEDGTYSVVFGAVCLLGVVAGLFLQVRAYLALGTLFLTLDVIANLVYAGLRDHRVGFVLLSVSGLTILGIMIAVTLKRDQARALLYRIRSRFKAWD